MTREEMISAGIIAACGTIGGVGMYALFRAKSTDQEWNSVTTASNAILRASAEFKDIDLPNTHGVGLGNVMGTAFGVGLSNCLGLPVNRKTLVSGYAGGYWASKVLATVAEGLSPER